MPLPSALKPWKTAVRPAAWRRPILPLARPQGRSGTFGPLMGRAAGEVGIGMLAAVLGTAVMILCLRTQEWVHQEPRSTSPARAISAVFELTPNDERAEARLATAGHWAYGISLGALRGLMSAMKLPWAVAGTLYFLATWVAALVMLPGLGVTDPLSRWKWREIAEEGVDHFLYAAATEVTFAWLHPAPPARR